MCRYQVPRTLLVRFADDPIDETPLIAAALRQSRAEGALGSAALSPCCSDDAALHRPPCSRAFLEHGTLLCSAVWARTLVQRASTATPSTATSPCTPGEALS